MFRFNLNPPLGVSLRLERHPWVFRFNLNPPLSVSLRLERHPWVFHFNLNASFVMTPDSDLCTSLVPRKCILCLGDLENALCRLPFCLRLNFPVAVIANLRVQG